MCHTFVTFNCNFKCGILQELFTLFLNKVSNLPSSELDIYLNLTPLSTFHCYIGSWDILIKSPNIYSISKNDKLIKCHSYIIWVINIYRSYLKIHHITQNGLLEKFLKKLFIMLKINQF